MSCFVNMHAQIEGVHVYGVLFPAGQKCLDVGCGIGGPLREIALFSGAHVTGRATGQLQHMTG